jgi:hypothetical protein
MDKAVLLLNNPDKYIKLFSVTNIEIRKIYPNENEVLCTAGNYPNCNVIRLNDKTAGFDSYNFIVMCRKISVSGIPQDKCELGKIIVRYEQK